MLLAAASTSEVVQADESFQSRPDANTPFRASTESTVQQATHAAVEPDRSTSTKRRDSSLPLPPPRSDGQKSSARSRPLGAVFTVLGSLAVVLGLFFGVAWLMRRGLPPGAGRLPAEVVEVLGYAPLAARRQLHVLRFGNKVLLVCVSQDGAETLAEIDDAAEADRLVSLCRQARPADAAGSFPHIFGALTRRTNVEPTTASGGLSMMAARRKSATAGEAADV